MADTIRVVVVDDQALVRTGFRMILDAEPDITVVGEAADGLEAIALVERARPHVVLMDIRMPGMDGVEATGRLSAQRSALSGPRAVGGGPYVLMLTTFELDEYVFAALRAGASGFLLKDTPPEDLVEAVRLVASGEGLLAPAVTRRVIEAFATQPLPTAAPVELSRLTDREQEVLVLMARGRSNSEIAGHLHVSETTVKTHVGRVLLKLDLRDRVQAVVLAYEAGLVIPGS